MATKKTSTKDSKKITLKLDKRTLTGRKVKQLRAQGIIPANVFGKGIKSVAVQTSLEDFQKVFEVAGETNVIYLTINSDKKEHPVLISNIQLHPVEDTPLHVDFHEIDLSQKVTATVALVLEGTSPAEEAGAIIVQPLNEIDVEALPADLPNQITVDISGLKEIGDSITIKDLKVDSSKVTLQAEPEEIVVLAQEQKEEEEPEPAPEAEEGEATEGEAAPAEGEATEGDVAPEAEKPQE